MKAKLLILLVVFALFGCSEEETFAQAASWWLVQSENAVEYVSTGGAATMNSSNSIAVNYPSSINTNDLLILFVSTKGSDTFSAPAEWTSLGTDQNVNLSFVVLWKLADGDETSTVTVVSNTTSGDIGGIMYSYRNVNTTTPTESVGIGGNYYTDALWDVTGDENDLGVVLFTSNDDYIHTGSGTDWYTNSAISTPDAGGFTFLAYSYPFVSTGTSSDLEAPGYYAYHGRIKLVINAK